MDTHAHTHTHTHILRDVVTQGDEDLRPFLELPAFTRLRWRLTQLLRPWATRGQLLLAGRAGLLRSPAQPPSPAASPCVGVISGALPGDVFQWVAATVGAGDTGEVLIAV